LCALQGTFDETFDWLRKSAPVSATSTSSSGAAAAASARSVYIYNTYFFRGAHYWMYENRFNRTRYGDPLVVAAQWPGLPADGIDAFAQVIAITAGADYRIDTYFFKGRHDRRRQWRFQAGAGGGTG